jgi:hypothetical protein
VSLSSSSAKFSTTSTYQLSSAASAGTYTFSSVRIISAGAFTIAATATASTAATTFTTDTTASLQITNYVTAIALSMASTTVTQFIYFTLTATLTAEDGTAFTGACTVTLTESSNTLSGTKTAANSAGTATFSSIYFNALGSSRSIVATCPATGGYSAVTQTQSGITVVSLVLALSFTAVI